MTFSTRLLLAASLCLTPLGWAAAQDQQQGDQRQREKQEQHPQQQQRPPQQPQLQQQHTAPPQGNSAPQGKGAGGPGAAQQFQRPPQTNAAPPSAQTFQRPPQTNAAPPSPPTGATASPTPPPGQPQFRRVPGPPQNSGSAPTGAAQQQQFQQQQFQQRSVQRGGAPTGSAGPQTQQTTTFRGNFQGGTRSGNPAAFAQHHGGAAPTQFNRGLFYGRDYAHFTPRETTLWRRGAWRHEFHDGRFGWWYAVDGIWYFYDEPIYPYPTFVPDVVYIPEEEYDDGPVYADEPPEAAPPQYGQPATYYYYFCPELQTYYPYVTSCPSPWQPVPAAPQ